MDNEGCQARYGWAPTPVLRKGAKRFTNNLGAPGIFIPARTRHLDQAFKVFEWYMAGEYGIERAKTGWGMVILLAGAGHDSSRAYRCRTRRRGE